MLLTSIVNIIFAMIIFARIVELHPIIVVYLIGTVSIVFAVVFYCALWAMLRDAIKYHEGKWTIVAVLANIVLMTIGYAKVIIDSMQ